MNFEHYDNLRSAITVIDSDGFVLFFNKAARKRLDIDPSEHMGTNLCDGPWIRLWPELRAHFAQVLAELQKSGTVSGKMHAVNAAKALHLRYNGFAVTATESGHRETKNFVLEIYDVTERVERREIHDLTEQRLQSLIDTFGLGSSMVDDNGVVVEANDRYIALTGRSREEVVGHRVYEWIAPEYAEKVQQLILDRPKIPSMRDLNLAFVHPDGSQVDVEVQIQMTRQPDGSYLSRSLIHDVTERTQHLKAQEEARARLELILGASPSAVAIIDPRHRKVTFANARAAELFELGDTDIDKSLTDFLLRSDEAQLLREKFLADGRLTAEEVSVRIGNGALIHVLVSAVSLGEGNQQFVVATMEDLTEFKHAQEKLRESEQRLRMIIDAMPLPMVVSDMVDGTVLHANQHAISLTQEHFHRDFPDNASLLYRNPDERSKLLGKMRPSGFVRDYELQSVSAEGHQLDLEVSACETSYQGKPVLVAVLNDVTQRKQADEAVRQDRSRLEMILDALPVGITIRRASDSVVTYVNRRACEIHGHAEEELIGTENSGFADDPDLANELSRKMFQDGRFDAIEVPFTRADGATSAVVASGVLLGESEETSLLVAIQDISDRKKMEAALRESEERFRAIVHSMPHGIIIRRRDDFEITYVNPRGAELLGVSQDALLGDKSFSLVVDPDNTIFVSTQKELDENGRFEAREVTYRRHDGSTFPAILSGIEVREGGEVFTIVSFEDITPLRRAREELQVSESRFASLFQQSVIPTQIFRPDGTLEMWNEASERQWREWGLDIDIAQDFNILEDPQAGNFNNNVINRLFSGSSVVDAGVIRYTLPANSDGGRQRKVYLAPRAFSITNPDGTVRNIVVMYLNITSQVEAEEKLRQSQKMEAIGQLTGGIAHDFNNILAIIQGNLDLLSEKLTGNVPLDACARYVDISQEATERAATLTQRLLAFSRKQALQPETVLANDIILGMADLLKRSLGEQIELDIQCCDDVAYINIDVSQLETGLLNLAINSRDAMPGCGVLTIRTELTEVDSRGEAHDRSPDSAQLVLTVSDTGCGMDPDTASRAVEPFFTTKEVGKGSGLGLSMVEGFVNQSGGEMKIESMPGRGTTVRLFFPICGTAPDAVAADTSASILRAGNEIILLVEDDPAVQDMASEMLQSIGYGVICADDAAGALATLGTYDHIDLLFTDLALPNGVDGKQLAEQVSRIRPEIKIVFASGYAENIMTESERTAIGVPLVPKPYRRSELANVLREVLDS